MSKYIVWNPMGGHYKLDNGQEGDWGKFDKVLPLSPKGFEYGPLVNVKIDFDVYEKFKGYDSPFVADLSISMTNKKGQDNKTESVAFVEDAEYVGHISGAQAKEALLALASASLEAVNLGTGEVKDIKSGRAGIPAKAA